jgi:hypothetical protein
MFGLFRKRKPVNYRAIAKKHHKQECAVCGALWPLDVHHKNKNHDDNRPKNLQWLCRYHHLKAHGKVQRKPSFVVMPEKHRRGWFFFR